MAQDPDPQRAVDDRPDGAAPQRAAGLASDISKVRPGRARRYIRPWTYPASLGWPVLGTFLPGAGLLRTRWKRAGAVMLLLFGLSVAALGLLALLSPNTLIGWAVDPQVLAFAWVALIVIGVIWSASVLATHLALRPPSLTGWQRLLGAVVVGFLTLVIALPTFVGARTIYDTSALIQGVFSDTGSGGTTPDPSASPAKDAWTRTGRLNVLILGGDSGESRDVALGARTDSVILASINTETGKIHLFSLPRQTQRIPFPEGSALAQRWPDGFRGGAANDDNYFLNAIYNNVPAMAPELMPTGVPDAGAWAVQQGVSGALGVDIDYYVMINMDGFIEFINALGGITVNINKPIPVGGSDDANRPPDRWLPPGPNQHLNGQDALWYARGRYGEETGNYARMARQQCLIRAVVQQANPTTVLTNYESLAKAGQNIIETDVPNHQLPALLQLALHVQRQGSQVESYQFQNEVDGFSTVRPDWELVHQRVQAALNPPAPSTETPGTSAPPETTAPAAPTTSPTSVVTPTGTPSVVETPAASVDECAYHPTWQVTPAPTP